MAPMSRYRAPAALLATVVALGAVPAGASGPHGWRHGDRDDHHAARRLVKRGEILPMGKVLKQALRHQPGRLLEAEFETEDGRHLYEFEILDAEGQVWELEMDAADGRLLKKER